MTYDEALKASNKDVSHAEGEAYLANVCFCLGSAYPISAKLLYEGAQKKGVDGKALMAMMRKDQHAAFDLQFVD